MNAATALSPAPPGTRLEFTESIATSCFGSSATSSAAMPQSPVGLTPAASTIRMAVRTGARVQCTTPRGTV